MNCSKLSFKNANKWFEEVLRIHKKWATMARMIPICADIGLSYVHGAALA